MLPISFALALPGWVATGRERLPGCLPTLEQRMGLVLTLAERNVAEGTGGPFAAAIFQRGSGTVISIGVNCVVAQQNCLAHAEILAIGLAHRLVGSFDLGSLDGGAQLVASSQMCAMCLGAVVWSGVAEVVFATRTADVIATVGFDEGPTPPDFTEQLGERGIAVVPDVLRDRGLAVLRQYVAGGGPVYNARHR